MGASLAHLCAASWNSEARRPSGAHLLTWVRFHVATSYVLSKGYTALPVAAGARDLTKCQPEAGLLGS